MKRSRAAAATAAAAAAAAAPRADASAADGGTSSAAAAAPLPLPLPRLPPPLAAASASSAFASSAAAAAASAAASPARQLTVVLEQASLETVKTKRGFELLCCDEHGGLLTRAGREPASARPDIAHQCLLALLDSPLNRAGLLRVLVSTADGVLVDVSPACRIPRTYRRFAGLAVQLLHKLRVRAADSAATLLRVVKGPVTVHLPVGATIVGLEAGARLIDAYDLPAALPAGRPVVVVVGAMAHGDVAADYLAETFSVSRYPLSAACAIGKLLNAFERAWGVL